MIFIFLIKFSLGSFLKSVTNFSLTRFIIVFLYDLKCGFSINNSNIFSKSFKLLTKEIIVLKNLSRCCLKIVNQSIFFHLSMLLLVIFSKLIPVNGVKTRRFSIHLYLVL